MRQQQFPVTEVETWRHDRTCHQLPLFLEVVAIMRGVTGAVGEDQRPLTTSAGTTGTLSIVGRVGRCIAQVNHAEGADIDPQLHGGRTEKCADRLGTDLCLIKLRLGVIQIPFGPEAIFAIQTSIGIQLAGVILTTEALHGGEIAPIKCLEELVGLRSLILVGAALDDIGLDSGAITDLPDDTFQSETVNLDLFILLTSCRE